MLVRLNIIDRKGKKTTNDIEEGEFPKRLFRVTLKKIK